MLKTFLEGHDKYYGISDILRMFYGVISEDRENTCVNAEDGPDMTLVNTLGKDSRSVTVVKERNTCLTDRHSSPAERSSVPFISHLPI